MISGGELLRELWSERARMLVVGLGVVWGTLSLTVLLAFDSAMHEAMDRAMEVSGRRLVILQPGSTSRPYRGQPAGRPIPLSHDDTAALASAVPRIDGISSEYASGATLRVGKTAVNANMHGVDPAYGEIRFFHPESGGRFLNEADMAERRRVVFLGSRLKQRLFGDADAVGRRLLLDDQPFTVVGVGRFRLTLGNYRGMDEDRAVIPATTFRAWFGWRHLTHLVVQFADAERGDADVDSVLRVLAARKGFDPADRAALEVNSRLAQMREVDAILWGSRIFTTIVGLLSLMVAALGVSNVMYVLVEERTREIGIAIALGARPRWIGCAHLLEAVVVMVLGGLVGLVLSALLLWGLEQIPMDERARGYLGTPEVSVGTALVVALILGIAGAVAGYYPARRAAAVQPIEALRDQ